MHRMIVIFLLVLVPLVGYAQEPTVALSSCLGDKTSGRDRKDLAKWVFLAMGAHPENRPFLAPGIDRAVDEANKTAADLFTRLITESCTAEFKAAVAQGGTQAIQAAFSTFGQLAMQELMTDRDVKAALGTLDKHMDKEKLNRALSGK